MALTVGQVADLAELGLIVRTDSAPLDRPVRWVAVSELPDPAPWLDGGELLLTTGMGMSHQARVQRAYIERLAAADVAALGFGVGIHHERIPPGLLKAADAVGLPVLEIPQPVPFVAVGKAVLRQLTAEEFADAAASFEAQRKVIRLALGEGSAADIAGRLISMLARHVDGFALLVEPSGVIRAVHPASARGRAREFDAEIARMRPRGLLASSAMVTTDEHIVLVPVGARGEVDAMLVVGAPRALAAGSQAVMNLVVSLLSWRDSADEGLGGDPMAWRAVAWQRMCDVGADRSTLMSLGALDVDPKQCVVACIRGDALTAATRVLASSPWAFCSPDGSGRVLALLPAELPQQLLALADESGVAAIGVSTSHDASTSDGVLAMQREARQAATAGSGVRVFGQDDAGLLGLVDSSAARAWAEQRLAPLLSSEEGVELCSTLRAWLRRNGHVDSAAQDLNVHRHTVRHRLRRAEALLGRALDDPDERVDLWQALSVLDK